MITRINSLQNKLIKETCKLKINKYIKEKQQFLVEGFHILEMALKNNDVICVFTLKQLDISDDIPQYIVTEEIINKLSFMPTNQGVIGVCKIKEKSKKVLSNNVVLLDSIKDPGNFGTIIRICNAFNINDIILLNNCVSEFNDKVIMASQGGIFGINFYHMNINEIETLKNEYKIISTTLNNDSEALGNMKLTSSKNIVVFGNESNGIGEEIIKISDRFVKIEMENIDSLNVGVAAGIVLYKLFKNN